MSIAKINASWERHGLTGTTEHVAWKAMKARCYNPRNKDFEHYGGRGIGVCHRWQSSFLAFLDDMGHPPTTHHSLDRVHVDGDYEPNNCRWADKSEQRRNQRKYLYREYGDVSMFHNPETDKWSVSIQTAKRRSVIGVYGDKSDAELATKVARKVSKILST